MRARAQKCNFTEFLEHTNENDVQSFHTNIQMVNDMIHCLNGTAFIATYLEVSVFELCEIAFFRAIRAIGITEITCGDMNICAGIAQYSQFAIIFLCSFYICILGGLGNS